MSEADTPARSRVIGVVVACVLIPTLWAAQLWVGVWLARTPAVIFAPGAPDFLIHGVFPVITALAVIWLMYKTPFAALSWALAIGNQKGGAL